ncbi:protein-disulfide reductase DsbD family protein [Sulfurovum riftiae]|uniref:Cytochrome C biogenesis protein n=1 Tax=Sulfurovum riftiae TaxID=1630136 RepID=A0A151CJJ2_9BACT|nr:protein-disulfide reductase DsbD [Sulfurovum riftiae]KYJ87695.1 cytochrome C biogenesis protein [Sulfurovum riftiae]
MKFRSRIFVFAGMLLMIFSALAFGAGSETVPVAGQTTLALIAATFVAGLLLTFTPCVLPMIPIISSIIAGQGEHLTKVKAFWLSFSYVMGTAVTYALMGALAGATGEQLQSYFQNSWAIGAMSIVFVLMALPMFGVYTLQLPSSIQSRLNAQSQKIAGGSIVMVFLLGMISALILGACVSPVLISFLSVAIASHDPALGALTMFSLALGMGVPLVIVGLGAGQLIPRAGGWMDQVKHFFGVLLLAVAIYLFNELGVVNELLLWGVYLLVLGVYMRALEPLPETVSGWKVLFKAIGVLLLLVGAILIVGAAKGNEDLYQPLKSDEPVILASSTGAGHTVTSQFPFELVRNMDELKKKQAEAVRNDKFLVIYFYSDTCGVCKKLKATTLKDPKVRQKLSEEFVAVRVNITGRSNEATEKIRKKYKIFGTPSFVFFDRSGNEMPEENFYGYQSPEEFYDTIDIIAG